MRGFCCLHVHVSSVWLSIVGDAFISLSQLALCCTCCCKRKNPDGFRLCFFLFVVEFALQQLDGNSSASHCGVWYSKIIATTTAALALDTESEREKKSSLPPPLFSPPFLCWFRQQSPVLVAALELCSSRDKPSSHFLPLFLFAHFPSMSIHWKPVVVAFQSFAIPGAT